MAKASLSLPNGTVVQIEGSSEEVRELLAFYGGGTGSAAPNTSKPAARSVAPEKAGKRRPSSQSAQEADASSPNLSVIVNLTKNCDEADSIGRHILDKISQLDRTLLPLYIVHEHIDNAFGLTSGEIAKVTKSLSVPVHISNVSRTLTGIGTRYVVSDRIAKKGETARYKLSRRGLQHLKSVIAGKISGAES